MIMSQMKREIGEWPGFSLSYSNPVEWRVHKKILAKSVTKLCLKEVNHNC